MGVEKMEGKICVVTGANSGIGKETAIALAKLGATVVMACRNEERGEAALREVLSTSGGEAELMVVDVGEVESVDRFASAFYAKYDHLDVLVNNAGIWSNERKENSRGYEMMFAVNHLGYFYVAHKLLPALKKAGGARVVNVSSEAHRSAKPDLDDVNWSNRKYKSVQAYGDSKLFNIWFTKEFSRRYANCGITTNCLHPGVVNTNLADGGLVGLFWRVFGSFLKTPEQGAQTQIYLASSPDVEGVTGKYFKNCQSVPPRAIADDTERASALWDLSEKLLGIRASGRGCDDSEE